MQVSCCAGGSGGGGGGSFSPGPLLSGVAGNNNDTVAQAPTAGSMIFGNATPLWDELVIGTAGFILTVASGFPAWTDPTSLGFANKALSNLAAVAVNASLIAGADATIALGSSALRWTEANLSTGAFVWAAASDAQPTSKFLGARIDFGAGGASATDCTILRLAAGVLGVGAGNALRFQGSGSNYVGIVAPANPTAYTITLPSAVAASNGLPMTSTTGGVSSWALLGVPGGGTGATSFTAFAVICAGTTSTNPFQPVSGLGNSGQVLTSNGAGALPTWQAASGGSSPFTATAGVISQTTSTDRLKLIIGETGDVGLEIKGIAAQTADYLQINSSAGSSGNILKVNTVGTITVANTGDTDVLVWQNSQKISTNGGTATISGGGATLALSNTNICTINATSGVSLTDTTNISVSGTTGTKIGTATTQKLGFWNAAPVVQPALTGTTTAGFTANASANAVFAESTFTGNTGATAYTISDVVRNLKTAGLLAA